MSDEWKKTFLTMNISAQQGTTRKKEMLDITKMEDHEIRHVTRWIEDAVKTHIPNAKVLFTEDHEERVSVGVYDCPLTLNKKGQFKIKDQYVPQLISLLFKHRENLGDRQRLFDIYSACLSAYHNFLALSGEAWLRSKVGIYPGFLVNPIE